MATAAELNNNIKVEDLSPPSSNESTMLSVDKNPHDVLLQDIVQLSTILARHQAQLQQQQQQTGNNNNNNIKNTTTTTTTTTLHPILGGGQVDNGNVSITLFHDHLVTCFDIGGEKRLCFPQVINVCMPSYSLAEITKAATSLNIHLSCCTREQLDTLKLIGTLQQHVDSCALITNTDAERLIRQVRLDRNATTTTTTSSTTTAAANNNNNNDDKASPDSRGSAIGSSGTSSAIGSGPPSVSLRASSSTVSLVSPRSQKKEMIDGELPVQHDCFGGCQGRLRLLAGHTDASQSATSASQSASSATCIECRECDQSFTPSLFVTHSHTTVSEKHTCHWGFDSANWRAYVQLDEAHREDNDARKQLEEFKMRFVDCTTTTTTTAQTTNPPQSAAAAKPMPTLKRKPSDPLIQAHQTSNKKMNFGVIGPKPAAPLPVTPKAQTIDHVGLLAYYQTLLEAQKQQSQTFETSLLARANSLAAPKPQGGTKAAEAAAGLLALSMQQQQQPPETAASVAALQPAALKPMPATLQLPLAHKMNGVTPTPTAMLRPFEAPKKHLLHQFEEQQRRLVGNNTEDTARAKGSDADLALSAMLDRFVTSPYGRRLIETKLTSIQTEWDAAKDALTNENRILRQELSVLRGKYATPLATDHNLALLSMTR